MHLRDYLMLTGIKQRHFAKLLGISDKTLHNYLVGYRNPTEELAKKIESMTGGIVTVRDMHPRKK